MTSKYAAHESNVNVLTTELDSLGDAGIAITATALSNDAATTERDLFATFALSISAQGTARSTGARCDLYVIPEVNTSFAYGSGALSPSPNHYRGSFFFDADTSARRDILEGIKLPNSDYHVLLINNTGQAFAASGNVLSMEITPGYEDV